MNLLVNRGTFCYSEENKMQGRSRTDAGRETCNTQEKAWLQPAGDRGYAVRDETDHIELGVRTGGSVS